MKPKRDKRARATGRLGVTRGERYALLPDEVLRSAAFKALPDFAVRVLVGLAAQYHGHNNGSLALTSGQAQDYGVRKAKLFAGFELLLMAGLIQKCRQGGMKPLGPTKYAVTWKPIDEGKHDLGIHQTLFPSHAWTQWSPPTSWLQIVRMVLHKAGGRPRKNKSTVNTGGERSVNTGVTVVQVDGQHRGVQRDPSNGQHRGDTSKTLARVPAVKLVPKP